MFRAFIHYTGKLARVSYNIKQYIDGAIPVQKPPNVFLVLQLAFDSGQGFLGSGMRRSLEPNFSTGMLEQHIMVRFLF